MPNGNMDVYIEDIMEYLDTGMVTVRIAEYPVRRSKLCESRLCRFDGKRWTLGQTLQWALNERGATYNWTLGFWERDFVL